MCVLPSTADLLSDAFINERYCIPVLVILSPHTLTAAVAVSVLPVVLQLRPFVERRRQEERDRGQEHQHD